MKLLILVLIIFLFPLPALAQSEVVISITEEGFNPSQVSVQKGTNIKFINNSSHDKWPASDLHPTHEIYPEFDPKKGVKPNETFQFKAEKVGEHRYHDHLNPHIRGVIRVEGEGSGFNVFEWLGERFAQIRAFFEPKESLEVQNEKNLGRILSLGQYRLKGEGEDKSTYTRSQMDICYKSGGKDSCYEDVAFLLWHQFGLSETLETFQSNEKHPEIFSRCHEATHFLSRNEYQKEKKLTSVYEKCSSVCHGGCYHGAIEAYLKDKNLYQTSQDLPKVVQEIPNICGKQEDFQTPLVYNECLHGIGHGELFISDGILPTALRMCDAFSETAQRETCYGGVFMENSSSSTSTDHQSRYVRADDPMYPCNTLDKSYQRQCYSYQSSYFAYLSNWDWGKVADLCIQVPEEYRNNCFEIIGTNQVGFTQDFNLMKENCSKMPSEYQDICVQGVITSLAGRYRNNPSILINFCDIQEDSLKESCFQRVGNSISQWFNNKNEARAICNQISSEEYKMTCQSSL